MKVKYEFEIRFPFEVGNCIMCPLSYWHGFEVIDGYIDYEKCCVLDCTWENCPLEIVNEERL